MAGVSHHSWNLETEVPTVLTRATVADGKYIQKDTIDPLINRDEALKSWLEDTGDELIRVSGELMDTISSVSSTLDTKIDTTSAALHNEITAASASLHEELTAASASLDAKIDTASGNIMSAMKTSADNLIQYTNTASAYVQGNLQTSADTLVSALNDLDNEFTTYLKTLCSAGEVGQVAVWENVSEGTYALSARPIVASPDNTNGFVESSGIKSYVDTQINEHVAGLFSFKGSKSVDEINALNNMSAGDVYNLNTNGIISAGEFGNMSAQSGDNIVYVTNDGTPHWDKMAAAFNDENCMKLVSSATSGNIATFNSKGQVEDLGIDPTNFGKCEVIQLEGSINNPSFWTDDMTTTYHDKVLNAAKDALQNGKSLIIDVGSDREGSQCYYERFALSESCINDGSSSGWFEFKYIGDSFEVGTSEADATDNIGFRLYYGSSYEDKCKLIEKTKTSSNLVIHISTAIHGPEDEEYYFKSWKQYIPEILDALEHRDENNVMIETYTMFGTGRGGNTYTWRYGGYYSIEGRLVYYFYNISQNATVIGIRMMPATDAETGEPSLDFSVIYRSGPELKPGQGIDIIHNQSSLDHSLTINAYNISGGEGIGVYTDDVNHVITISAKGGEAGNNSYLGNALAADCVVENPKYEIALGSAASAYGRAPTDKIPAPGNAIAIGAYSIASVKEDVNPYNKNGAAIALGYACSSLGHTTVTIGNSACASGGGNIVIGNSCFYKAAGDSVQKAHPHGVFAQRTFENFLYDSCILGAHTGGEGYMNVAGNIMLKDCVISGGEQSLICNNFMWNNSYIFSDNERKQYPNHNMLLNTSLIVNGFCTDNNFVCFGELCDPATGSYDNDFCNNINFGGVIIADPAKCWYCNNNVILSLGELGYGDAHNASAGGIGRKIYSDSILKYTDVESMYAEMRRYSGNERDSPIIMIHKNHLCYMIIMLPKVT